MNQFEKDAKTFGARKLVATDRARQLVATRLVCGIDLSAALEADQESRTKFILRIERAIERERLKGIRRHWSYDLNRHIALKQVLDTLRELAGKTHVARRSAQSRKENGARRRR